MSKAMEKARECLAELRSELGLNEDGSLVITDTGEVLLAVDEIGNVLLDLPPKPRGIPKEVMDQLNREEVEEVIREIKQMQHEALQRHEIIEAAANARLAELRKRNE